MRNMSYFQRVCQSFRFFRAGIKLRFQLNTNPQNYGCVVVSYWPNIRSIDTTIYQPINAKPHLMDVSATQALEIVVPFIHHRRWLDIPALDVEWDNLYVRYEPFLATVQSQTIPVTLQVWASFVDPEFDGAYEQEVSQAQSEIQVVEHDVPNAIVAPGALPLAVLGTTGAISAYQTVSSLINSLATITNKVEAVEKSSTRMKNLFKQSPETYKEPADLRPQYIGSIASLTHSPTVTLDAYPRLKFPPCELGDPNLVHAVLAMCKIPTIRQITFLETSTAPIDISYEPGNSRMAPFISYMDMMACMYRYWRGSVKVNIKFFTSPLIAGRIILRMVNSQGHVIGASNLNETPYRKIITVKGTTEISLTLPFIYDRWWKSMATVYTPLVNDQLCNLTADIISPLTSPGDLAPQVLMVVSVSAGEDFQLKGYTGWRNSTPAALISEAQSLADEWSTKVFEDFCGSPLSHMIDMPENDDTLELLLSRYSGRPAGVNFMDVNNMPNLTDSDNFDYVIRMFRYWRGSTKFKAFIDWDGTTPATTYWEVMMDDEKSSSQYKATTQGISRGCAFNKSDNGAPVEFTQPYFSDTEWTPRGAIGNLAWNDNPMSVLPLFLSGSSVDRVLLAAGHDFQLAYLLPPFTRTSSAYTN